jgi:LysM repeat protein
MVARSPARLLAPISLGATFVAFVIVLATSGGSATTRDAGDAAATRPAATQPARRAYVVRAGDSLLAIAGRTDVPIERLRALNPDVDPQALRPGQRIKLRP